MKRLVLLIACCGCLLAAGPAAAATLYVSASAPAGGDGSQAHPFASLATLEQASAAGDTLVVLPSSNTLDGGIALKPRQHLLGGGPPLTQLRASAPRPTLANTGTTHSGDAVTLAEGAEVSNIAVDGADRGGIYGTDVSDVNIHDNDVTDTNSSCTTGFVVQPFILPTGYAGVGAPLSSGLANGWAGILVDEHSGTRSVTVTGNTVHDATCADGIEVRASGTSSVTSQVTHNAVTRLQEDPRVQSVIAIGMQTTDGARMAATVSDNTETSIGTATAGEFGVADSEGLFANSAGHSQLSEQIVRNRFAHGLGHLSANCIEEIASNTGPTISVHVSDSSCYDAVGDILEAVNLSRGATMSMTLDHVVASHSTWPLAQAQHAAVVPGDDGDCLLIAASGAANTTDVHVNRSSFSDCAADGVALVSNVVDGSGPVKHLALTMDDSRVSAAQISNLRVENLTPVSDLSVRVQHTDLGGSPGTPVILSRGSGASGGQTAIDLGGGPLGSAGANCILGGGQADMSTTGYDASAVHDWWGDPSGPAPDRVQQSGGSIPTAPALSTNACGPRPSSAATKPARACPRTLVVSIPRRYRRRLAHAVVFAGRRRVASAGRGRSAVRIAASRLHGARTLRVVLRLRGGGRVVLRRSVRGCAPRPLTHAASGSVQSSSYTSGGLTYPYLVYTPGRRSARKRMPLVVVVHGCQTTAEQQMRATLYNQVAREHGFAVLYPDIDSTGALEPGPLVRCWRFYNPANWQRGVGDAAAIAGMTRAVMSRLRIDPERVYLIGMSSGAEMASIMARAYPDIYAAIGIHSGGPYGDLGCLGSDQIEPREPLATLAYTEMGPRARIVPMIDFNGDQDTTALPACAAKTIDQALRVDNLVADGVQDAPLRLTPASNTAGQVPGGHPYDVYTYRDPAGCVIAERWLIGGMKHYWSGGTTDPAYSAFTDPKGPNAAEASWRFFARYRKSQTDLPCAESAGSP